MGTQPIIEYSRVCMEAVLSTPGIQDHCPGCKKAAPACYCISTRVCYAWFAIGIASPCSVIGWSHGTLLKMCHPDSVGRTTTGSMKYFHSQGTSVVAFASGAIMDLKRCFHIITRD